MAAEWQNPSDADVILRASDGKEFRAHKLVLSLASSVFRDMFSIPQPPQTRPSELPIVDVHDPPEALEMFLQIIYPISNPPINDVETLASLLALAHKYDARAVLDAHRDYLPSMCISSPPIHVYAILCASGHEKEAEAAARRVSFASLTSLSSALLHLLTVEHYQRLVKFMVARDVGMRQVVNKHQGNIRNEYAYFNGTCCNDLAHKLYSSTIVVALQTAFEANPCIRVTEALGVVSSASIAFPPCGDHCRYNTQGLQRYGEGLVKELVQMADKIPW